MINPHNLRALLDENTSSRAPHYLIFTPHGTLLSFSSGLLTRRARDIAATAGGAWRILSDQREWSGVGQLMKVLDVTKTGGRLKGMVVEVEGGMMAVWMCKERVLVGVIGEEGGKTEVVEGRGGDGDEGEGDGDGNESDDVTIRSAGHKNGGEESLGSSEESDEDEASKQQVLVWKAEGMAEALREDLKDFVIPEGFY